MAARVMISAGEASGESHAAGLIRALTELDPDLTFFGMGGASFRAAGGEVIADSSAVSTVGFAEVIPDLKRIWQTLNRLKAALAERRPDVLVLIDIPEFNLRLAKTAKRLGIPVIYYIPPQVWAWRRGRVRALRRLCDRLIVIFPFEPEFYAQQGIEAFFSGHPFADLTPPDPDQLAELRAELGCGEGDRIIALLPGSRRSEIKYLLQPMMETADRLGQKLDRLRFVLPMAPGLDRADLAARTAGHDLVLTDRPARLVLAAARAGLVCSGTATLEAAATGTPMVVVYKSHPVSYALARAIIRGDKEFVAMPNLIAGEKVVRTLLQGEVRPETLAEKLAGLIEDGPNREKMLADFQAVRERLGKPGASQRAAADILNFINRG